MRYIVARITGGLGNQLLNYAVALGIAERTGREVVLDLTDYVIFPRGRKYELCHFIGPSRARHWNYLKSACFLVAWIVCKRVNAQFFVLFCRVMKIRVIQSDKVLDLDPCFVDDDLKKTDELLYLIGVYAHTPYLPSDAMLRDALCLKAVPEGGNRRILEQVRCSNSVSLHVRRSDYLQISNGMVALGSRYYRRAIEAMSLRVANPLWVIFSDDIAWCRAELAFLANVVFVEGNGDQPWEDLRLMVACKHHIIANSTFSWWGAIWDEILTGSSFIPSIGFPVS